MVWIRASKLLGLACPQLYLFAYTGKLVPGAHNDNEEEKGEGRSANRPRKRLKFQIFLTVVALLSLEHWHNEHGANRP